MGSSFSFFEHEVTEASDSSIFDDESSEDSDLSEGIVTGLEPEDHESGLTCSRVTFAPAAQEMPASDRFVADSPPNAAPELPETGSPVSLETDLLASAVLSGITEHTFVHLSTVPIDDEVDEVDELEKDSDVDDFDDDDEDDYDECDTPLIPANSGPLPSMSTILKVIEYYLLEDFDHSLANTPTPLEVRSVMSHHLHRSITRLYTDTLEYRQFQLNQLGLNQSTDDDNE